MQDGGAQKPHQLWAKEWMLQEEVTDSFVYVGGQMQAGTYYPGFPSLLQHSDAFSPLPTLCFTIYCNKQKI